MDKQKLVVVLLVISILFSIGTIYMSFVASGSFNQAGDNTTTIVERTIVNPPTSGTVGFELVGAS